MSGWIKLHRKTKKWEWYGEPNTTLLFIHLLLSASHTDTKWRGEEIKAGQVFTGRKQLADETGLTEQKVRTALKNLQSTNEVTIKSTKKYSIITITKWKEHQISNQEVNQQSTSQTTNDQPTSNHIQEGKEGKEVFFHKTFISQSFVPCSEAIEDINKKNLDLNDTLKAFINNYAAKKIKVADWQAQFRSWVANARPNNFNYKKTRKGNTI